jgi:hypothetical protein
VVDVAAFWEQRRSVLLIAPLSEGVKETKRQLTCRLWQGVWSQKHTGMTSEFNNVA